MTLCARAKKSLRSRRTWQYPAGMQPLAAAHLLEVLPAGTILDPFMGGGTTLVEALRSGRQAIGADASPLALFAATHHTWRGDDAELQELRAQATEALLACDPAFVPAGAATTTGSDEEVPAAAPASTVATTGEPSSPEASATEALNKPVRSAPRLDRGGSKKTTFKDWEPLRDEIERLAAGGAALAAVDDLAASDAGSLEPLWFCFAAAQQRSERYRYRDHLAAFDATVDQYCHAVAALRAATPDHAAGSLRPRPRLLLSDARELSLSAQGLPLADGLLTSPPYAGVYDYLSHAREARAKLGAQGPAPLMGLQGTPDGRDWPTAWRSTNEMGARKAMRRKALSFFEQWEADQRAWLAAARANLRAGGRLALLVGDGEGNLDALDSTVAAAEHVGLQLLASATIASTQLERSARKKGKRRPEHAILLEVP